MARKKKAITVPLETIWEIPDAAWERLQLLVPDRSRDIQVNTTLSINSAGPISPYSS